MNPEKTEQPLSDNINIEGFQTIDSKLHWAVGSSYNRYSDEQILTISFKTNHMRKSSLVGRREFIHRWKRTLEEKDVKFLYFKNGAWYIDISELKKCFPTSNLPLWLKDGIIKVKEEYEVVERDLFNELIKNNHLYFVLTKEEMNKLIPKKIFLSHKGKNKPYVREYFHTLKLLGFDPWLDEDAMTAGVPLDRSILAGIEDSIAAVFFITPEYVDEDYLADEINYAIAQMRNRKGFKVISLHIIDSKGKKGIMPKLLTPYVYKPVKKQDQLAGLREIIRALPIEIDIKFNID